MIKSEEENQFVYELLRNTSGENNGWIGLHRKADKKLYWLDNRPVEKNFQNWKRGEPNNGGGKEDCGLLIGGNSKGKWNDRKCSDTGFVAICQWPI